MLRDQARDKVGSFLKDFGMTILLETLIELLSIHQEPYLRTLKADLEAALKKYEARYDDEPEEEETT